MGEGGRGAQFLQLVSCHRNSDLDGRGNLTNAGLEKERLALNYEFVRTPNVLAKGMSPVDAAGMQEMIDTMKAAFNITSGLKGSDLYDPSFLPPADRLAWT